MTEFVLDEAGLAALADGMVDRHLEGLASRVADEGRAGAPVNTGRLRDSIRFYRDSDGTWVVIADVPYSLVVHQGSRPHPIEPRRAKVLRFPSKGGSVVYTKRVNHPGTRPQPFLTEALRSVF